MVNSFDKVFMGAAGTPTGASDDEFNRVSFLSHFDGANNGVNNAFDDGSTSNHTITANGNVTQGSFGPFARPDGEFGVSFDGSGDYLSVPDSDDFNIGSGLFTAETWIFPTASPTQAIIMGQWSGSYSWVFLFSSGNARYPRFIIYDGSFHDKISSTAVPLNQWSHLALVRETSNVFKMYLNGDEIYSVTLNKTANNSSDPLTVGANNSGGSPFQGFLSNTRFVKGTAVYTSAFTPSTSPLTAVTNTKLLTCQSNRFVDNSASGHTVTPSGNAAVTAFGPFLTSAVYDPAVNGASAYFDGNGDYLTIAASNDFDLSDGDITWEFFVYPTAATSVGGSQLTVFEYYNNSVNLYRVIVTNNDISVFQRSSGDYGLATSNDCVPTNSWAHVAVTRASNNEHKIFCNGVLLATSTNSNSAMPTASVPLVLGRGQLSPGNRYFPGYITDFRLTKGSLVYTSNFTPPTAPLTAITNTKLLLNMADGQAIDSAAQNNLTLYGNAKISSTQSKFGGTSMYFDGTGDYATYANAAPLGSGDWTIETFVYVDSFTANRALFQYGQADGSLGAMFTTDGKFRVLRNNVSSDLITSTTFSADTWYHLAIVYYNGVMKVYINGTADSTTYTTSTAWTFTETTAIIGGRYYSSGYQVPMDGYLDEFRVSHFARYTNNFSPPTEPFADKGQDA